MSSIDSGSMGAYVSSVASYNSQNMGKTGKADAASSSEKTSDIQKTSEAGKKSSVSGKTIGSPKLSEKAARYYEQLKSKYSNMDFILVSADQKEQAKAQAGSYANANKMVVLIDEEKIEKMAEDENYRKQYEGIIANAATGLSSMSTFPSSVRYLQQVHQLKVLACRLMMMEQHHILLYLKSQVPHRSRE